MAALEEVPILCGDLSKRAGSSKDKKGLSILSLSGLKKRWVALFAHELRISDAAGSGSTPKHIVPCGSFKVKIDPQMPQVFSVQTKGAVFEFTGDTDVDAEVWVNALIDATIKARNEEHKPFARHEFLLGTAHSAALLGEYSMLKDLLHDTANTCSLNLDSDGHSPAHCACYKGNERCLELLLESGANVKIIDSNTLDTLLHVACEYGTEGQVRMLLRKHEELESQMNKSSLTPLDVTILKRTYEPDTAASIIANLCAVGSDASDSLKHLYGNKVVTSSTVSVATLRMPLAILKALLRHGAKPNLPHSPSSENNSDPTIVLPDEKTAIERILTRASPGGLEVGGADLDLIITLAAYGAHLNLKHLASVLSPLAIEEITKANQGWCQESEKARFGTVIVNKKGWVSDHDSQVCLACHSKFTTTHRRHHCRFCAELVCSDCSTRKLQVNNQSKPQRACDRCFNREHGEESSPSSQQAEDYMNQISVSDEEGDDDENDPVSPMSKATAQMKKNQITLNRAADKSASMKDATEEYRNNTKALKEKMKQTKSSIW